MDNKKFEELKSHYESLEQKYASGRKYPDKATVQSAIQLMNDVLSQKKDNTALIGRILKLEDDLFESKEGLQKVEDFFKSQVGIFDAAAKMELDLRNELDYLSQEPEANAALNKIRLIVIVQNGAWDKQIPELNTLMATVREGHDRLLAAKREEILDIVRQCMGAIHEASRGDVKLNTIVQMADNFYSQKREQIKDLQNLALLDGLIPPMIQYKDAKVKGLEEHFAPQKPQEKQPFEVRDRGGDGREATPKKVIKQYNRQIVFPAKRLESEADIDAYVEMIRGQLKQYLENCDGIQLQ